MVRGSKREMRGRAKGRVACLGRSKVTRREK